TIILGRFVTSFSLLFSSLEIFFETSLIIPILLFSCFPSQKLANNTQISPTICTGIIGAYNSITLTSNDVAARMVGPPHGTIFIVPAAKAATTANVSGLIFKER